MIVWAFLCLPRVARCRADHWPGYGIHGLIPLDARSCLWRIPNVPCLIANAICRALKATLLFLLKVVDAFICK